MAKKNLNPADAYRKAQRKKELKKNKADRSKTRDFALVKKDTWDLEDEIAKLEAAKDPTEQSRLAELKAELEKINRKKAEYVAEHPEQRRLVYRPRRKEGDGPAEEIVLPKRKLFDKKGLPLHPERSVYYDPVMNSFGVAPPGMPYMERPPLPGEVWSDEESEEDEDEIVMPPGPPPGEEDADHDVDDILMPLGPPPRQLAEASTSSLPPLPSLPPAPPPVLPPLGLAAPGSNVPPPPAGLPPHVSGSQGLPPFPPTLPQGSTVASFPPPPPPLAFHVGNLPPPPPGFPVPGFPPHPMPNFPPIGLPSHAMPPPPPGFFPRGIQSAASMQDPLSSIPHMTFQAHHNSRATAHAHPSLPPNPTQAVASPNTPRPPSTLPSKPSTAQPATELAVATVSAAPQLRDFKKEATAFVPASLKRKRPGASTSSSKVNAAPSMEEDGNQEPAGPARPDLLGTLRDRFGPTPSAAAPNAQKKEVEKKKDDYDKFMEEMGDILAPTHK